MTITDCGGSGSLITVSEVWKSTERQPRQIGDHRTAPGRKQPVGGDGVRRPDVQLSRPDEACVRVENGDIVASLPVAPTVRGHGINPTENPIPDLPPADRGDPDQPRACSPPPWRQQDRPGGRTSCWECSRR